MYLRMRRFTIETTRCVDARVTIAVGSTKKAGDFFLSYLQRFYVIHKRSELLFWTISSVYLLEVFSTLSTSRFSAAIIIVYFSDGCKTVQRTFESMWMLSQTTEED